MDHYQTLGVTRHATAAEIKAVYRTLARTYHPDRNPGDDQAEERFKRIVEAYRVLSDPQQRRQYDMLGPGGVLTTAVTTVGAGFAGVRQFFRHAWQGTDSERWVQPGRELRYTLAVSLQEVLQGTRRDISFAVANDCARCEGNGTENGRAGWRLCLACEGKGTVKTQAGWLAPTRACSACHGKGRVVVSPCSACSGSGRHSEQHTQVVDIPPGVYTGYQHRVVGQGEGGYQGGPAGDLVVVIQEQPHVWFKRQESAVVCDVPVSYFQLVTGTTLWVPTVEGTRMELVISPNTQPATVFRLRGYGLPVAVGATARGDAQYRLMLEWPTALSEAHRQHFQRWWQEEGINHHPQQQAFVQAMEAYPSWTPTHHANKQENTP